jgi:hypothetical protein
LIGALLTRKDFQQLSEKRIKEAESLFRARFYEGAYYLAGIGTECALKACIAKQTRRFDFPEKAKVVKSYDHNLSELIKVAGLQANLEARVNVNQAFAANWRIVTKWQVGSRYDLRISRQEAEQLFQSITHPTEGVLPWLRTHW